MDGTSRLQQRMAVLRAELQDLLAASDAAVEEEERLAVLREAEGLVRAAEAVRLRAVRSVDGVLASGSGTGRSARVLARTLVLDPATARRDVLAARATCPDRGPLRRMGAALAAGAVSRCHLDVAVAALEHLPADVRESQAAAVDEAFVEHDAVLAPGDAAQLGRRVRELLTGPVEDRHPDPRAAERRGLTVARDRDGMLVATQAVWEGADSLAVEGWLRSAAGPRPAVEVPAADGSSVVLADTRTPAQRRADAVAEACRIALAQRQPRTATRPGASAHVLLTATVDPQHGTTGHPKVL